MAILRREREQDGMVSLVVKRIAHPIKGGKDKEKKRQKVVDTDTDADALKIDLDGVPLQPPIRKRASQMKEGLQNTLVSLLTN